MQNENYYIPEIISKMHCCTAMLADTELVVAKLWLKFLPLLQISSNQLVGFFKKKSNSHQKVGQGEGVRMG